MLSDGEMIQRRNIHHTASDSAPFSAYFLWLPWLARHVGRLIANARLEFSLSRSKDGLLKISNRERMTISHLAPQSRLGICLATRHSPPACPESRRFHPEPPRALNHPRKFRSRLAPSDFTPLAPHHLCKTLLVTSHLIYCRAIRIPRKPLKTSDIRISNRR